MEKFIIYLLEKFLDKKYVIFNFSLIVDKLINGIKKYFSIDFYFIFTQKDKSIKILKSDKIKKKDALKIIKDISKKETPIFDDRNNIVFFSLDICNTNIYFLLGLKIDSAVKDALNLFIKIIPLINRAFVFNLLKDSSIVSYALHKMIWDKNKRPIDYEFVDINNAFEIMTGLKKEDVIGNRVRKLIKGIEKEGFIDIYGDALKKGKELVFERFSQKLNKYYLVNFKPLNEDFFITIFYDITKFKEAEKVEIEFYKWYKSTFESTNAIKLIIDPENGKIVDANEAALKFYGYEKKELLNKTIQEINVLGEGVFNCMEKVLNGYCGSFEFIHRTKAGVLRNVRVYPNLVEKNGKKYIYSIIFDITDEVSARKKINMLFEMMDKSIDEFYLLDSKDYRFLYVNETAIKNLGYTKEELLSMTPSDIAPQYTKKRLDELFKPFKKGEIVSKTITTFHKRKDGSRYPVKVNLTKHVFDGKLYFFAIVEDITKDLEKEKRLEILNRLYYTLSQANQLIVRSKDENELFLGLSRIIVEYGGVNVCFFLKKVKDKIDLVSFYGAEEKDIREIINLVLSSKNMFATRSAIVSGNKVVNNDYFAKVKVFDVFRRIDVKSVASFPIKVNGKVRYSITIYSKEFNFFTDEIVKLIEELCGDIEYALAKMDFEKKLLDSEKRYKAIFENSSSAMCIDEIIYDENGNPIDYKVLDINKTFEKITGLKRKDIIGKTSTEIYGTKNPLFEKFVDVVKNKTSFHDEIYFEPLKKYISLSVSSFNDRNFSTVFIDVSDRYYYSQSIEKLIKTVSKFSDVSENNLKLLFDLLCEILNPYYASYIQYNNDRIDTIYISKKGVELNEICRKKIISYMSEISNNSLINSKLYLEKGKDYLCIYSCVDLEERKFIILFWNSLPQNQKQILQLTNIIVGFISSEIDKLKSKRELILSNQKYQTLLNNQLDAVCLWKPDTEVVLSNKSYSEIHGFDIIGKKWIDFVPQDYKELVLEKINSLLIFKKPIKYEHPTISRDGKIVWYEWIDNPIMDDKGDVIFVQSNGRDITDKKTYEIELLKLKTVIEQAPIEIIVTDENGNIEYVNPYFEEMTGYSKDEVIGKTPRVLKSGKHDDDYYKNLWETIKSGKIFRDIMVNKRKDGSLIYDYTIISPLKDEKGRITHFVGIKRDITREIEEEKIKQHSQRMELIGTLAGGIAHDFNNILASIMGNSEIILQKVKDEDIKKDVLDIINSSQKASSLIKNLLHFAKKQPFETQVFELGELISSSKDMLSRLIGERYDLKIKCSEKLYIKGDPNSITQVLINLVVNAKDAMPNGGNIEISCFIECLDEDKIFGNFKILKGCYAVFCVKDYGIGIEDEIKDKIFSPFFTTKEFGTGLGLSTAYSIIKRHMGYIVFDSTKGKGTEFRVYIPIHNREKIYEHKSTKLRISDDFSSLSEKTGYNIVFVDDDEGIRRMAQKIFKMMGLDAKIFDNPKDVIDYVEKNSIVVDLLITDVVMEHMNGKQLVDYLKEKKLLKSYIFISGYSDDIVDREGVDYNSEHFLSKPFRVDEFSQKIEKILKDIQKG